MAEISKAGAPNKNTAGQLGDIYINTLTGDRYKLAYISTTTTHDGVTKEYEWELVTSEIPIDVATKEYVDEAILSAQLGGTGGSVDLSAYAKKTDIPTKTSSLVNDSGFINEIPTEYVTEEELNKKGYLTSNTVLRIEVVSELPEVEENGVLYIVK